jgi:hypothetical protein
MILRRTLFVSALVGTALAAVISCSDAMTVSPCRDIPAGGCPLSNGVACQDPACEAAYACLPSREWQLDHTCPPHDAGTSGDGASDGGEGGSDGPAEATRPFDANIDAPPGASGGPDCQQLQTPDCPLGFALACPMGCCGCEDLFVCQGGGWNYYATCKE